MCLATARLRVDGGLLVTNRRILDAPLAIALAVQRLPTPQIKTLYRPQS